MARKQVIKPDFTINNINAVNNDPGARNFVGGKAIKPANRVQTFGQGSSRATIGGSQGEILQLVNKTDLTATDFNPSFSNTIQFGDKDEFSFLRTITQDTILFTNANTPNSKITVDDDSTLSMNKSENTTVSNFTKTNSGTYYTAPDSDNFSFVEDAEVSALQFSANANSKVHMSAYNADFNFGDATSDVGFSFAFWINVSAIGSTQYLFGLYGSEYYSSIRTDGSIRIVMNDTGNTTNQFSSPQVSSNDILQGEAGNWVHIAIVYTPETSANANDEQVQFYKNGSAWGSAVVSPTAAYVAMHSISSGRFTIGHYSHSNTSTLRFAGMLSNFLVFRHDGQNNHASVARSTTPLTADEVLGLYSEGRVVKDYNHHPKGDDLVGYWKMDEDVSEVSQITDYSGENNHLDTIGSAVTEDSTSGLYVRQDVSFTISFWMKKDTALDPNPRYIVTKGYQVSSNREFDLAQISGRGMRLRLIDTTPLDGLGTTGRAEFITDATFLSNSTSDWEHITVVYDASTQTATFYNNGTSAQSVTLANADTNNDYNSMYNAGGLLFIGQATTTTTTLAFGGQLAHIVIMKHDGESGRSTAVPTASQVLAAYNNGNPYSRNVGNQDPKKDDIVGYWKLDGTTATVGSNLTAGANVTTSTVSDLITTEDVDMTISFFLKRGSGFGTGIRTIFAKRDEYWIYIDDENDIRFNIYDKYPPDGGGVSYMQFYLNNVIVGDWNHVSIRLDASANQAYIIINGGSSQTMNRYDPASFGNFHNTTNDLTIGFAESNTSRGFIGQIAHLAIFKHDGGARTGGGNRSTTLMDETLARALYNDGNVYDYTRHTKATDLVGYWKLNETAENNATVTDYSGEGNNGVMTAATSLNNPLDSGLVELKDNSFTVGFWMNKDTDADPNPRTIIRKDGEWEIQQMSNRRMRLILTDQSDMVQGDAGYLDLQTTTNFISAGTSDWEHIVVSYDAVNRQAIFVLNGTTTHTAGPIGGVYNEMSNTVGNLELSTSTTNYRFDGLLSNVIIFDHGAAGAPFDALDALELYSDGYVYDYNNHSRASDIVGWWKLDDHDSVTDSSGNGHSSTSVAAGDGLANSTNSGLEYIDDQDFAIGFFIRPTDNSANRYLFRHSSAGYESYFNSTEIRFKLSDITPKQVNNAVQSITHQEFVFTYTLPLNVFTHVIFSYDKSERKMHLYINGVEQGTGTAVTDADYQEGRPSGSGTFYLGNYSTTNSNLSDMSHFVFFRNRHLTEVEAVGLYNNGFGYDYINGHTAGSFITAFYKLDDTTATLSNSADNNKPLSATDVTSKVIPIAPNIPGRKKAPQLPMRMHIPGIASLRTNPQK